VTEFLVSGACIGGRGERARVWNRACAGGFADDADVVIDREIPKAAVFGRDPDHSGKQHFKPRRTRYPRPDVDRETDIGGPVDTHLFQDCLVNVGTLLFCELHALSAGLPPSNKINGLGKSGKPKLPTAFQGVLWQSFPPKWSAPPRVDRIRRLI
jgi:hypothetical protein